MWCWWSRLPQPTWRILRRKRRYPKHFTASCTSHSANARTSFSRRRVCNYIYIYIWFVFVLVCVLWLYRTYEKLYHLMHLAQCEHTRLFLSETGVQSYLYTYCVGLFGVCIMRCILHTKRSTVWCTSRSAHALSSPPVGDGLFSHIYIYTYIYICKYMYTYIYIHIYNMHVSFNMNIRRRVLFSKHCLAWCSPPIASSCWRRVSSHIYIYIYIYMYIYVYIYTYIYIYIHIYFIRLF